jgi:hypothetical protein
LLRSSGTKALDEINLNLLPGILRICQTFDAGQTIAPSLEYHNQKIVLVVDNFRTHYSKTLEFLEPYTDQFVLFALPTYSPLLNNIELLWKHLRRKATHNHLFETIVQLVKAVCCL